MKSEKQEKKEISKLNTKIKKYYDTYPGLEELHEKFVDRCAGGDNESAHGYYDDILYMICKKHDPKLLKLLDDIIDITDIMFWYA